MRPPPGSLRTLNRPAHPAGKMSLRRHSRARGPAPDEAFGRGPFAHDALEATGKHAAARNRVAVRRRISVSRTGRRQRVARAVSIRIASQAPKLITRAEFEAIWDGRVVSAGSPGFMQRVRHALADTCTRGRSLAERVRHALADVSIRARGSSETLAAQTAAKLQARWRRRNLRTATTPGSGSGDAAALPRHRRRTGSDPGSDGHRANRRCRHAALSRRTPSILAAV
jgi:hypothetical protein